jgi:hypothetical protein
MEGILTGEQVLAGRFFLNECANKAKLTLVASGVPYVISTLRGRVDANRIA